MNSEFITAMAYTAFFVNYYEKEIENAKKIPGSDFFQIITQCRHTFKDEYKSCLNCDYIEKYILINRKNINEKYLFGNCYIQAAVEYNNERIVDFLLNMGAIPDVFTRNNCCPLISAVKHKNENIVNMLIDYNTNLQILYFFQIDLIGYMINFPTSKILIKFIETLTIEQINSQLNKLDIYETNSINFNCILNFQKNLKKQRRKMIEMVCNKFIKVDNSFLVENINSFIV